jgi:hypothetical protein
MKRLHFADGGRPLSNNDLSILQEELYKAVEQQYSGLGSFIVSGCSVSGTTIASGLVFIDGKILPFAGAGSVTFPAYLKQAAVQELDVAAYETGGSHPKRKYYSAELVGAQPGSGGYIVMSSTGGRSYYDAISSEVVRMRGNQTVEGNKTFSGKVTISDFISLGKMAFGGHFINALKTGGLDSSNDTLPTTKTVKDYVDIGLGKKADKTYTDTELEKKVDKVLTWNNVTYATDFAGNVQYTKDDMGFVHLKGLITSRPTTGIQKPFNLPVGFQPIGADVNMFLSGVFDDPSIAGDIGIPLPLVQFRIAGTGGSNDGDTFISDRSFEFSTTKRLAGLGCNIDLNGISFYAG